MDKAKPTYLLTTVKHLIVTESYLFSKTSEQSTYGLGLSLSEAVAVILNLQMSDFYKSTTEYYAHDVWQDVYKPLFKGVKLYIKFKVSDEGDTLVITSFKRVHEDIGEQ